MKFLKNLSDRDFYVCSDCKYFKFLELVDERYPFKRGICKKFDKIVDDVWETWCDKIELNEVDYCLNCSYFRTDEDDEDEIEYCTYYDDTVSRYDDACENYEEK